VNSATVNTGVQLSLWCVDFLSFGCVTRSGIAESSGRSVFSFGNLQTVLDNGFTNLHSFFSTAMSAFVILLPDLGCSPLSL
jgi:hypothetical protein